MKEPLHLNTMWNCLYFQIYKREKLQNDDVLLLTEPFVLQSNGKADDGTTVAGKDVSISISGVAPKWSDNLNNPEKASNIDWKLTNTKILLRWSVEAISMTIWIASFVVCLDRVILNLDLEHCIAMQYENSDECDFIDG